jgi:putative transposase
MSVSKTAYYYRAKKRTGDIEVEACLKKLADEHKRWGFDKMMMRLKMDNKPWNHKRVYRIYCDLGLNLRIKPRKRIPKGEAKALIQPLSPNVCWSVDFMSDVLSCGSKFRTFNVVDDYNRECLLIEPSVTLPARRVTQLLDEIAVLRGYPDVIRVDHGPEFESYAFKEWAKHRGILIHFIQPGKPAQNGFIERFNRTYREDVLDINLFSNLFEVRAITREWLKGYNTQRPHESLAGLPPVQFAEMRDKQLTGKGRNSTFN